MGGMILLLVHEPSADDWVQSATPNPLIFRIPAGSTRDSAGAAGLSRDRRATTSRWFKDATADYPDEAMHAALVVNIPNYASAIVSTTDIVAALAAL